MPAPSAKPFAPNIYTSKAPLVQSLDILTLDKTILMKKLTTILCLVLLAGLTFSACKSSKKANGTDASGKEVTKNKKADKDSLYAEIQTSPCYGTCPVYKMSIYKSGFVVLEAKRFLDSLGVFHGWLDDAKMKEIASYAKEIGYFELDSVYNDMNVTDVPSTKTTLNIEGKKKTILSRWEVPRPLRSYEKMLDSYRTTIKWKVIRLDNNPNKE